MPNLLFVAEPIGSPQATYSRIYLIKLLPLKLWYVASFFDDPTRANHEAATKILLQIDFIFCF
jgi:hypothetical protein